MGSHQLVGINGMLKAPLSVQYTGLVSLLCPQCTLFDWKSSPVFTGDDGLLSGNGSQPLIIRALIDTFKQRGTQVTLTGIRKHR